jgi:hypothetical protein
MISMKRRKQKDVVTEIRCPACGGTGLSKVTQPVQPGRKIYPPPCKQCSGKGRKRSRYVNQQQLSKNDVMTQRLVNLISDIERIRTLYQLSKNLLDKGLAEFRGATVAAGGEAKFQNIIEPYIAASFPATQLMYKHIVPYIAQQYPSDQAIETAFQSEQKKQIERDYPSKD